MKKLKSTITLTGVIALVVLPARGDTFGRGPNTFTIDFVRIGNAYNLYDPAPGVGEYSGAVSYEYNIGVYAVSQDQVGKAVAGGLTNVSAGPWTGDQPAANMTWYEAAAFVNWLNTSTGHTPAYKLNATATGVSLWSLEQAWTYEGQRAGLPNQLRNKDAYYFLPSEDEYYKAAYFDPNKPDGEGYWLYATGSDTAPAPVASGTAPDTAVYGPLNVQPASVYEAGGLSPYGTMGQSGNVQQWTENFSFSSGLSQGLRGSVYNYSELYLRSTSRTSRPPLWSDSAIGFRVASGATRVNQVPEAGSTAVMLALSMGILFFFRKRSARSH